MGLDMYLVKCPKELIAHKDEPFFMDEVCNMFQAYMGRCELGSMEVMLYWSKQNQIFEWFVQNLGVNDDIPYWVVSKEKLAELLNTCEEVLSDGLKPDGIPDEERCQAIMSLPDYPRDVEWIGNFEYDDWFLYGIRDTVEELRKLFAGTDFETESIFFCWAW